MRMICLSAKVVVASPRPAAATVAAAHVSGADAVLCVGGAQAVAAMAFGCVSETLRSRAIDGCCDKGWSRVMWGGQEIRMSTCVDWVWSPSVLTLLPQALWAVSCCVSRYFAVVGNEHFSHTARTLVVGVVTQADPTYLRARNLVGFGRAVLTVFVPLPHNAHGFLPGRCLLSPLPLPRTRVGGVPSCDIIVGPGNNWVTAAKSIVSGR